MENQMPHNCNLAAHQQATKQRAATRESCSAARALEIVGERWSLLIVRDAIFRRTTRFSEFQRNLGIAPNILASRLDGFVEAGLMEARRYSDQHDHSEYVLTKKGLDLQPVIIALTAWGDRWAAPQGPPIVYQHEGCGGRIRQQLSCTVCRAVPRPVQIKARPGPGRPETDAPTPPKLRTT
jgi:DNA-binding HxlR family transcriptional regulator